jgi:starch-binding outer membrane protein, SusD/RagB family
MIITMKNKYIIGCLSLVMLMCSCKKNILDIAPTNQINDVLLWSNQSLVLTYTANCPND